MPTVARDPALAAVLKRPFAEQVAFFRGKLGNLVPTATWRDLWKSQHDRAFMVAGAAKADLLADLAAAVDAAIAQSETLEAFRKRFADIVQRHGWHGWTGEATAKGRAWRTRVIYQTNLATSYAAGRMAQLKQAGFRYWIYKHSHSVLHPRPLHLAWHDLTLPTDHPFWQSHYPPNGWGCRCRVVGAAGPATARRLGGDPDKPIPPGWDSIDPKTGEPVGIDKGWGYQPGATVADGLRDAVAKKTIAWPYEITKAYMSGVPASTRDLLATAIRSQPETGEAARRYAERALGMRRGGRIDLPVEPYQTLGLLTTEEAARIGLNGIYDWALAADEVRHAINRHGDPLREAGIGQIPLVAADYAIVPRALLDGR